MKKSPRSGSVFPDPTPALIRAAKAARVVARQTGTKLVIVEDGKIVKLDPGRSPSKQKTTAKRRAR